MKKTADMQLVELRLGRDLRDLILELYQELHDWAAVAERLDCSRQTLSKWRRILAIGDANTRVRGGQELPVTVPRPCPSKPGFVHCAYCGGCNGVVATACYFCDGDFKQEGDDNG